MAELDGENVPAYRMVRVTAPDAPVAALADVEAWRARESYPEVLLAGGPVFGVVRESEKGGWEVVSSFSGLAPQDARDDMGCQFRKLAQQAEKDGDMAAYEECEAAAKRTDWETVDELTVLGVRYRVARAERFIRSGPQGPEPPRPTDPDPAKPGESHKIRDSERGMVIDPFTATGMSEGILKVELLALVRKAGTVPRDVREDSLRAAQTHPGGVLLPAAFGTAEKEYGYWRPDSTGTSSTPQGARDTLAMSMRVMIPWQLHLGREERVPYTAAADRLDEERGDELKVAGREFRVVRIERLVRIGPDGPEGPRPSDPDPQPPVMVQDQQLREQGVVTDDEDEDAPMELDEDTRRLAALFKEEEARRAGKSPGADPE
ncbi:DUF5954 family protein [Streptomyces sp. UNOC14_S4]|uniref:DUF5954 family protein n=1 Tax=Streptomyces sp. UNOC14_S4 TaxID=2872340 RepID=UPI001E640B34|nr:DUF5954 family protein [Streptomyces sp. UNOC14_S4]MCC3771428.1 PE-PGRS family protein [Streptomyces sp. UNOC14_S4]